MPEPIISVSGLRGIVGESLTPDVAARYATAFASTLPPGAIILGRDGRASGPMLAEAIERTLTPSGRDVLQTGIAATPTVGVIVKSRGAAGGIQISASHNPAEYNGLKLFGPEGRVISAAIGERVLSAYRKHAPQSPAARNPRQAQPIEDTTSEHLKRVLATIDVGAIRRKRFRVLLDSNAGAGSLLGRRLLESLGCETTLLGGEPNGQFEHPPEPTKENLTSVCQEVLKAGAAIGFCQDPDADRLAIIDENGRYIGEEYTLALCLDHVLRERKGPIVINCATSRMAEDIATRHGVACHRSAVGEANVVDLMLKTGAVFGGEGNGGPIDPRVGFVRDSFVGMALVLAAMASRNQPVGKLADSLPRYEIRKTSVRLEAAKLTDLLDRVAAYFSDASPSRLDGLRLQWPDRWLIIRGSNTEPIVRIIAEAPTAASADELIRQCRQIAEQLT